MPEDPRSTPETPTYAEAVLLDVLRMALSGRSDELPARLRKVVDPGSGRRKKRLSEAGRTQLALLLAQAPVVPQRHVRGTPDPPGNPSKGVALPETQLPADGWQQPILDDNAREVLDIVVREHNERARLLAAGLRPTRTLLLSGPPGVGKSMTIAYLANALGRPLLRIEAADVMGSLLGESARALTAVFEQAYANGAVLALDEIDALAKRRDDVHDVGEFKRFVTTLLLELDRWGGEAPVIAATNHLELLDPALERRFELHVRLTPPSEPRRREIIEQGLNALSLDARPETLDALVAVTEGQTGAHLDGLVRRAARRAILDGDPLDRALLLAATPASGLNRAARERFAAAARDRAGLTTRQIGELLGCSHTAARRMALAGAAALDE